MAIIISYPISASGIIVLLKTPTKYREFFPTLFVKTTDFQLVFNFEQTRTVTIFEDHGIKAELAIIISYPTSASGIIVLLKTPTKYQEFFPTLFVKTTGFQLVFNFEQTRTVTIFGEHGNPKMAKPIRAVELHYPMIQFSIKSDIILRYRSV